MIKSEHLWVCTKSMHLHIPDPYIPGNITSFTMFFFNGGFDASVLIPNHLVFFVDFKQTSGMSWKIFVLLALFQPMVPFIKFSSKLCTITITIIKIKLEMMNQLF